MLFIYHHEAQFVMEKDVTLNTSKGPLHLVAGQPLGLGKSEDGRLFIGQDYSEDGVESDVLEIYSKGTATHLLEACQPSTFNLGLDEDGQTYIKTELLEQKVSLTEKLSRITLVESVPKKTLPVSKLKYQ